MFNPAVQGLVLPVDAFASPPFFQVVVGREPAVGPAVGGEERVLLHLASLREQRAGAVVAFFDELDALAAAVGAAEWRGTRDFPLLYDSTRTYCPLTNRPR